MTFPQPRQASPLMPPSSASRRIPPSRPVPPAMTGFWVVVDGVSLPTFTECQGLAAEYEVEPWTELGQNDFVHQLPGRVSYSPVTLTRYVDKASAGLAAWFDSVGDVSQRYRTARISAVDAAGKKIAHWNLKDVFASKYTGPSFSVGGTTAATESVELVHHGFAFTYTGKR